MKKASARLGFLLSISIVLVAIAYVVGSFLSYQHIYENQVLEVARSLRMAMQASWNYVDDSQDLINYNSDGSYDFKGVYCSVAGKSIAQRFTMQSNSYGVRYVRYDPRSGTDHPDDFESRALDQFVGGGDSEYYAFSPEGSEGAFRYVYELEITTGCLECHGEPRGEKDVTGFKKEGMKLGDVAGAVSISIPLDTYEQERSARLVQTGLFFALLMVFLGLLVRHGVNSWITRPLEEKAERHQRESEEKSNFLTMMSHELRTPLSSIVAFADMWEKDLGSDEKAGSDDISTVAVHEIKENSQVLLGMINNTIDLARLEAGRYELCHEEGDLADVVNAALASTKHLAQKKGITLSTSVPEDTPIVVSDWEAVRKILVNLIANALKFTEEGGRVDVGVRYDAHDGLCILEVSDTGRGIPEEDFERIFERFSQSSQPADSRTGSGLGLALVKNLAEMLGGSVSVKSALGVGSVFTVTFPVKA
ncbi:ATP-binding protein [Arabiibacter massiliensis]|uniref:ATP-binding protein n=1 Tax=Arabiibacter massiliensis TaxID=1870985 RepID=UPI0009BC5C53|nr:ATP-binding protein [Arabiibacter massiliensis]